MRSRFPALFLDTAVTVVSLPLRAQLAAPHVRISQGELEGEVSEMGPLAFKGIPYRCASSGRSALARAETGSGMDGRARRGKVRAGVHAAGNPALMVFRARQ